MVCPETSQKNPDITLGPRHKERTLSKINACINKYFLIDKRGTFAEKPKSFSMNKIKETLAQMVR